LQHDMEYLKVEGHADLVRDPNSKAIINTDRTAYERAVARSKNVKRQQEDIRDAVRDINNLKCEMHEIKSLLMKLLEK